MRFKIVYAGIVYFRNQYESSLLQYCYIVEDWPIKSVKYICFCVGYYRFVQSRSASVHAYLTYSISYSTPKLVTTVYELEQVRLLDST